VISTVLLAGIFLPSFGGEYMTPATLIIWTYLLALLLNTILLFFKLLPRYVATGVRVVTWYALLITTAVPNVVFQSLSYTLLLMWYFMIVGVAVLAISLYLTRVK